MFIEGRNTDCFRQQREPEPDAYSVSACSEFAEDKTKFNHSESKAIKGEEPLANTCQHFLSAIQLSSYYM
jgi:hypothetical protein